MQFFRLSTDGSGTGDKAHAARYVELVEGLAQFGAFIAVNPTGNATATRIVRHQYQIATRQRNEGGQRRALVAAFILVHLDDDFLTFLDGFADAGTGVRAGLKIAAGNFLEGQKPVPVSAVIDKSRFQRRFDTGDDPLVNVAFALFLGGRFNVEVYEFLSIDNGDTEFFGLCRIE